MRSDTFGLAKSRGKNSNPTMKKKVPAEIPADVATPAPVPAPPHPLVLNRNESRWFNLCEGPYNGWFSFGEHGNPPFDVPVQVTMGHGEDAKQPLFSAVGIRTREINSVVGKEQWRVVSEFPIPAGYGTVYWRPLSIPPR